MLLERVKHGLFPKKIGLSNRQMAGQNVLCRFLQRSREQELGECFDRCESQVRGSRDDSTL